MKTVRIIVSFICVLLALTTITACHNSEPINSPELTDKDALGANFTFFGEKEELLKLTGVSEDPSGNILIPLKVGEGLEITLPNGNITSYRIDSETNKVKVGSEKISVCKEYKYKVGDSFITANIIAKVDCNWANNNVTITDFDHIIQESNFVGKVNVSNQNNVILTATDDFAEAEASGNIQFVLNEKARKHSELIAYRFQVILYADAPQTVVIKLII